MHRFRIPFDSDTSNELFGEDYSGKTSMTDPSHYMPASVLVARIIRGEIVVRGKSLTYDLGESDADDFGSIDPTVRPNFDITDAEIWLNGINQRKHEARAAKAAADAEEAKEFAEYKKAKRAQKQASDGVLPAIAGAAGHEPGASVSGANKPSEATPEGA